MLIHLFCIFDVAFAPLPSSHQIIDIWSPSILKKIVMGISKWNFNHIASKSCHGYTELTVTNWLTFHVFIYQTISHICTIVSGIILGVGWANERQRYNLTPSTIGWANTQNYPWACLIAFGGKLTYLNTYDKTNLLLIRHGMSCLLISWHVYWERLVYSQQVKFQSVIV